LLLLLLLFQNAKNAAPFVAVTRLLGSFGIVAVQQQQAIIAGCSRNNRSLLPF